MSGSAIARGSELFGEPKDAHVPSVGVEVEGGEGAEEAKGCDCGERQRDFAKLPAPAHDPAKGYQWQ